MYNLVKCKINQKIAKRMPYYDKHLCILHFIFLSLHSKCFNIKTALLKVMLKLTFVYIYIYIYIYLGIVAA